MNEYIIQARKKLVDEAFIYMDMANAGILTEKTLREYFTDIEITYRVDFKNQPKIRQLIDTVEAYTYLLFYNVPCEVMNTMLNRILTLTWEVETSDIGTTRELFALLDSYLGVKPPITIVNGDSRITISFGADSQ